MFTHHLDGNRSNRAPKLQLGHQKCQSKLCTASSLCLLHCHILVRFCDVPRNSHAKRKQVYFLSKYSRFLEAVISPIAFHSAELELI